MSSLPAKISPLVLPSLAGLEERERTRVTRLITLHLEWSALRRGSGCSPQQEGLALQAAGLLQVSERSVIRLFSEALRTGSYECFLPRTRADAGKSREWDEPALRFLEARFENSRIAASAYKETVRVCEANGWRYGSKRSAQRYLQKFSDKEAAMLALSYKEKDFYDKFEQPILRDLSGIAPMEIIVGDQMQFDLLVLPPPGNGKLKAVRPWVSAWQCIGTRLWTGMNICLTPTSRSIADALRHSILNFGVAEHIIVDNGKSYRAKILRGFNGFEVEEIGKIDLDADVWGTMELLSNGLYGFSKVHHALVENARAKLCERYFGKGNWADWAKGLPGYTGRRYDDMPDETRKLLKSGKLMSFDEFLWRVLQFIREMNQRPSEGQGMAGMSPVEKLKWYVENENWRPRKPADNRILDHMAMHSVPRIVQRTGIQHSSKSGDPVYYYHDALAALAGRNKKVNVRWSELDVVAHKYWSGNTAAGSGGYNYRLIPRCLIIYHEGKFLCEAEPVGLAQYLDDPETADKLKKQRQVRKVLKQKAKEVATFGGTVALPPGTEDILIEPKEIPVEGPKEDPMEREIRELREKGNGLGELPDIENIEQDDY